MLLSNCSAWILSCNFLFADSSAAFLKVNNATDSTSDGEQNATTSNNEQEPKLHAEQEEGFLGFEDEWRDNPVADFDWSDLQLDAASQPANAYVNRSNSIGQADSFPGSLTEQRCRFDSLDMVSFPFLVAP